MAVKFEVTEGEKWKRRLKVEVPQEEVEKKFNEIYRSLRSEAKIPGFRPGKAPMATIKARFSELASQEVYEGLMDESYREAVSESGLHPISQPDIKEIEFAADKPLVYEAEFEVRPEFEIEQCTGFVLKRPDDRVTEGEVKSMLEYIQRKQSELVTVDRPAQENDFVSADLEVLDAGSAQLDENSFANVQIELAKEGVLAQQFFSALNGVSIQDETEFQISYPRDHADKRFAGHTVKYRAKVTAIKELHLAELGDEFLKQMGEDIKSLDDFRDKLREDIRASKAKNADDALREEAIKAVIDRNRFDLPESMLGSFLDDIVEDFRAKSTEDVEEAEIRSRYRALGIRRIRWNLLLHKIAEKENIKVEQTDLDAWLQRFADNYGMTLEQAKKEIAGSQQVADLKETILESKVIDYIIENSTTETIETPMMQPSAE